MNERIGKSVDLLRDSEVNRIQSDSGYSTMIHAGQAQGGASSGLEGLARPIYTLVIPYKELSDNLRAPY